MEFEVCVLMPIVVAPTFVRMILSFDAPLPYFNRKKMYAVRVRNAISIFRQFENLKIIG